MLRVPLTHSAAKLQAISCVLRRCNCQVDLYWLLTWQLTRTDLTVDSYWLLTVEPAISTSQLSDQLPVRVHRRICNHYKSTFELLTSVSQLLNKSPMRVNCMSSQQSVRVNQCESTVDCQMSHQYNWSAITTLTESAIKLSKFTSNVCCYPL